MSIEARISIHATAASVFTIYADVANWPSWDPDTKTASINGPFQTGVTGRLQPSKGLAVGMRFTEVIPNQSFTVESAIPLCVMRFEHELHPHAQGVNVIHRVSFHGPLRSLFAWLVGKPLRQGLPHTLSKLKALAESRSEASSV